MTDIIYGSPEQQAMLQRATALWSLLGTDPRFCFQSRTVSVGGERGDAADLVIGLTRLQGYASCHFTAREHAGAYAERYQAAGLQSVVWNQLWGRDSALQAAAAFLADYDAPAGLQLKLTGPETPDSVIHAICRMSMASGVVPPPGSAMRGIGPKGMMAYVETPDGQVVASGGAFMAYHPDGPHADEAFCGMLATDESWRGQRLACWVGAQVILDMAERHGARGFSSGVKSDNPSSQAMCKRLGVEFCNYVYVGAVDPDLMGDKPVTR